jgi:hypothetical protein
MRPDHPRELVLTAWSVVHGLSALLVDRQIEELALRDDEAVRVAQRIGQLLMDGWTP